MINLCHTPFSWESAGFCLPLTMGLLRLSYNTSENFLVIWPFVLLSPQPLWSYTPIIKVYVNDSHFGYQLAVIS